MSELLLDRAGRRGSPATMSVRVARICGRLQCREAPCALAHASGPQPICWVDRYWGPVPRRAFLALVGRCATATGERCGDSA
jgi:hypothetical protein